MSGITPEAKIRELLSPFISGLEADGYQLAVSLEPDSIDLRVTAGPEACADCLIPKTMMEEMFRSRLTPAATGLPHANLTLSYPLDPPIPTPP